MMKMDGHCNEEDSLQTLRENGSWLLASQARYLVPRTCKNHKAKQTSQEQVHNTRECRWKCLHEAGFDNLRHVQERQWVPEAESLCLKDPAVRFPSSLTLTVDARGAHGAGWPAASR
jgi:hypothetical protein